MALLVFLTAALLLATTMTLAIDDSSSSSSSSYEIANNSDMQDLSTTAASDLIVDVSADSVNESRARRDSTSNNAPSANMFGDSSNRMVLETLQSHHVASAVLHMIELARNLTITSNQEHAGWCTRASLDQLQYPIPWSVYSRFTKQATVAVRTANLLTSLLLSPVTDRKVPGSSSSSKNDSVQLHQNFFWALAKVNVESDAVIAAAAVAFQQKLSFPLTLPFVPANKNTQKTAQLFAPFVYRSTTGSVGYTDLGSSEGKTTYQELDWYKRHATNRTALVGAQRRANSGSSLDGQADALGQQPSRAWVSLDDGFWTSPYLDCTARGSWLLTFSVPFFGPSAGFDRNQLQFM